MQQIIYSVYIRLISGINKALLMPLLASDAIRMKLNGLPSCRRRGFYTSCGARRKVETAAFLVDYVLRTDLFDIGY
ncbi:MAG: hypothetical protein KTR32_38410 [Granulosicoccus sp.]|nr:hypothetical protein [Granulosicoccus sp.]